MAIAIDRFRDRTLPPAVEDLAERIAADLRNDPALLLGYLASSVAIALEQPRWQSRSRLMADLRAVDLARGRR